MKQCPDCGSTYIDRIDFCFHDGMPLTAAAAVDGDDADPMDIPDIPGMDLPDIPPSLPPGPSWQGGDAAEEDSPAHLKEVAEGGKGSTPVPVPRVMGFSSTPPISLGDEEDDSDPDTPLDAPLPRQFASTDLSNLPERQPEPEPESDDEDDSHSTWNSAPASPPDLYVEPPVRSQTPPPTASRSEDPVDEVEGDSAFGFGDTGAPADQFFADEPSGFTDDDEDTSTGGLPGWLTLGALGVAVLALGGSVAVLALTGLGSQILGGGDDVTITSLDAKKEGLVDVTDDAPEAPSTKIKKVATNPDVASGSADIGTVASTIRGAEDEAGTIDGTQTAAQDAVESPAVAAEAEPSEPSEPPEPTKQPVSENEAESSPARVEAEPVVPPKPAAQAVNKAPRPTKVEPAKPAAADLVSVTVEMEPGGESLWLFVDGKRQGGEFPFNLRLPPGKHTFRVQNADGSGYELPKVLQPGSAPVTMQLIAP